MDTNATVRATHKLLVEQIGGLSKELGRTKDVAVARAILTEMSEIVHRVDLLQSLMFVAATQKLDALLPQIKDANDALVDARKSIDKVAVFVGTVTKLLAKVDQLIDLAKPLLV